MDIALAVVAVTLLLALAAAVYAMVSTLRGRGEA
jgi:hypothetical protein